MLRASCGLPVSYDPAAVQETHRGNGMAMGIRRRIYGGFGVLVILGCAMAGLGVVELTSISHEIRDMTLLTDGNSQTLEVGRSLQTMGSALLRYKLTGDYAAQSAAKADNGAVEALD